jgi:tetratricopeptide (TPR) repeat protein
MIVKLFAIACIWSLLHLSVLAAVLAPLDGSKDFTAMPGEMFRFRTALDPAALSTLRKASRLEGYDEIVDMQSLAERVFLLIGTGSHAQALQVAELLAKLAPDSAEAWRLLGHAHYLCGNTEKATEELKRAIRKDTGEIGARVLLGTVYADTGRLQEALDQFREAQEHLPDSGELNHNTGVILFRMGRNPEAIKELTLACERLPLSVDSRNDLALALAADGRHAEAARSLEAAFNLDPSSHTIRRNLASTYFDIGQPERSIALLAGVLLDGGDPGTWNDLIIAMRLWVKDDEPLSAASPDEAENRYRQGLEMLAENRTDDAMRSLLRAFALDPELSGPANDLGALLTNYRQPEAALLFLKRAAAQDPDSGPASQNVETLERDLQMRYALMAEARRLENEKTMAASPYEIHLELARIYQALGDSDSARRALNEAAKRRPTHPEPRIMLGILEDSLNRLASAETAYRSALAMEPVDPEIMLRLARVLMRLPVRTELTQEALTLATQAHNALPAPTARSLHVLATAQAMNGMFREAERTALRGGTMAELQGDVELARILFNDRADYANRWEE